MVSKKQKEVDNYPTFRSFPMYVILACGLIISGIGLYMTISHQLLKGRSLPGRYGLGSGQQVALFGPGILIIGIAFCVFPTITLIKNKYKK